MTTDLVERDKALAALGAGLRGVAAEGGRIALVAGEAGIGKTSVLRAFARTLPASAVWWGACDALHTPHPLAPLLDIARERCPRFAARLGGPRPALFDAVLDELRQVPEPTLVVVEDAHWADDATLDWLKFIGRRIERTRALLAVSFRDDEVGAAHPLRRVLGELPAAALLRIHLPPLTPAAVEALAQRAARPSAGVHAATRGNPFFVTEMLREGGGSGAVPSSVRDVVLARYARLDSAAQALVRLVSVLPGRSERWLAEQLLAPALADVEAALGSGLLVDEDHTLAFRHELGRVAVESSLSAPAAEALHAQVLHALAAAGRATATARLVHHALGARDQAAVSEHAPAAARQAAERGAHREAAAHWQSALQHGRPRDDAEHRDWLHQFATECGLLGRFDEGIEARRRLEQLARERGDIADTALQLSRQSMLHIGRMRHDDADRLSRQALSLLERMPPGAAHAFAWQQEAYLRMLNRDCEASVAWAQRAGTLAEAIGDTLVATAARSTLGTALLFLDYDAGVALMQQALAEHLAAGRFQPAGVTLGNLGSGSGEVLQLGNAERWLHESLTLATAHEFDNQAYYCRAWLALTSFSLGRWDEAAGWASAVTTQPGVAAMSKLMALLALARLRTRRGDPGAEAALDEGLALTGEHNTLQRIAPLRAARAEAALGRGDKAAAAVEVAAALPLAVAHRHAWLIGDLAYQGWRAGAISEPPPGCAAPHAFEIRGDWRAAAQAWQALGCPYEQARALAEGDAEAQREALAIFEALGARPAAEALRRRLHDAGVRGLPRGPRMSTREHAFGLTTRELQVLQLLCDGLRNADIAKRLHRSVRTVDHHLAAVFAKLGVDSRVAAIQAAQRAGLTAQSGQATAAK